MVIQVMNLCDYGCGQQAKYQFKNGKFCCSKYTSQCPINKEKDRKGHLDKKHSDKTKEKMRNSHLGQIITKETKNKMRLIRNNKTYEEIYGEDKAILLKEIRRKAKLGKNNHSFLTIKKLKKQYLIFAKEEEMRYNPDKQEEKEIQVHCKNHDCPNSKEKGGWFTPTKTQFYERIRQLEKEYGNDGSYFYCSNKCKDSCILYKLRDDPFKEEFKSPFTEQEYQIWRQVVLEQDNYTCQKCASKENLHCHHIQPVKVEPMLALDPTNGIVLCEKCHYEIGHKTGTECDAWNLSQIICKKDNQNG